MERAIPILPADDLKVAREFYVDRLGFDIRFEATEDGTQGLLGVARGTIWLTIDCPMSGHFVASGRLKLGRKLSPVGNMLSRRLQ